MLVICFFINFSCSEIAIFSFSEQINLVILSAVKNSFIGSLNEEKPPFLINNLASACLNVAEELYSRSFLVNIIDLIIVSSIKNIKIN